MHYKIIKNKFYKINDEGAPIEMPNINFATNIISEMRKHVENDVKEDKEKKDKKVKEDKEKKDKKVKEDKDLKIKIAETITTTVEKKKVGRPKKAKKENAL